MCNNVKKLQNLILGYKTTFTCVKACLPIFFYNEKFHKHATATVFLN